jgi:hypothetical protein
LPHYRRGRRLSNGLARPGGTGHRSDESSRQLSPTGGVPSGRLRYRHSGAGMLRAGWQSHPGRPACRLQRVGRRPIDGTLPGAIPATILPISGVVSYCERRPVHRRDYDLCCRGEFLRY